MLTRLYNAMVRDVHRDRTSVCRMRAGAKLPDYTALLAVSFDIHHVHELIRPD